MGKSGRNYQGASATVDRTRMYGPIEALSTVKSVAFANFDETVEDIFVGFLYHLLYLALFVLHGLLYQFLQNRRQVLGLLVLQGIDNVWYGPFHCRRIDVF